MFHLFKNTFITQDTYPAAAGVCWIFSDLTNPHLSVDAESMANSYLQPYGKWHDYLSEIKDDYAFFMDIFDHSCSGFPNAIYANKNNYAVITCKWLKMIDSNITAEQAYTLYKSSIGHDIVGVVVGEIATGHFIFADKNNVDACDYMDRDVFMKLYEDTVITGIRPDDFDNIIHEFGSNEWKLVNALYHHDKAYADDIITMIRKHSKRMVVDDVKDFVVICGYKLINSKSTIDKAINDFKNLLVTEDSTFDQLEAILRQCFDSIPNINDVDLTLNSLHVVRDLHKLSNIEDIVQYLHKQSKNNPSFYWFFLQYCSSKFNPAIIDNIITEWCEGDSTIIKV